MKPVLTAERYAIERAICDKAEAYRKRVAVLPNGKPRNYLTAAEAQHPDYAACDNAMRGRVEQYELLTNPPERFTAYISSKPVEHRITTWCGDELGTAMCMSTWRTPRSFVSSTLSEWHVMMAGRKYVGRSAGHGMAINLRRVKA